MKTRYLAGLVSLLLFSTQAALANSTSFTGNFAQDDNVQFFTFSISAPTDVTFNTLSYAGGVNAAGTTIAAGGFLPILTLWDAAGINVASYSTNGDISFTQDLTVAGSYILALTEYNNQALGDLPNGALDPTQFTESGQGNFTVPQFSNTPGIPGAFIAPDGSQRTSVWAVDISSPNPVITTGSVPEPETLYLLMTGIGLVGIFTRRKNR
ncbi:DVUA0089 family protein [Methylomonas sp. AM2-LC]|uniref:DVUA0089 family protein n=1 Tax=Methylomonas sp. AM2-LC TaxID=3153301 RepID=UPI003263817D